jgi:hypothetical protein
VNDSCKKERREYQKNARKKCYMSSVGIEHRSSCCKNSSWSLSLRNSLCYLYAYNIYNIVSTKICVYTTNWKFWGRPRPSWAPPLLAWVPTLTQHILLSYKILHIFILLSTLSSQKKYNPHNYKHLQNKLFSPFVISSLGFVNLWGICI